VYNYFLQTTNNECNSLKDLVQSLQGQLAGETQARRQAESQVLQDKRESDMKLREAIGQIEKANHSYQMVWNMKTGLEEKNNKNSEQKKILVKEVKQLRKRLEESDDMNDQMSVVNDKLIAVTSDLRQQVEVQRKKIDAQHAAMLASTDSTLHEAMRTTTSSENLKVLDSSGGSDGNGSIGEVTATADELLEEATALSQKSVQMHSKNPTSSPPTKHTDKSSGTNTHLSEATESNSEVENLLNEPASLLGGGSTGPGITNSPVEVVTRGGRTASMEWDFSSEKSASMLNMDWLSPEQRQLAAQRQQLQQQQEGMDISQGGSGSGSVVSDSAPKTEKRSSIALFKNVISGLSIPKDFNTSFHGSHGNNSDHGVSSPHSPAPTATTQGSSPALEMQTTDEVNNSSSVSSDGQVNAFIDANYVNGGKPTCFRCGGTVEGPKYSTCKCEIPAMSPLSEDELEKEDHGIQALKGFFKKGSSKAGGFASVARRKSLAVGKDLFSHKEKEKETPSSQGAPPTTSQPASSSGSGSAGGGIHFPDFPHLFSHDNETPSVPAVKKQTLLDLDDGETVEQTGTESSDTSPTKSLLEL
jgi:hypothetical protein